MTNTNKPGRKKLPTPEEIDVIVSAEFPDASGQCTFLCYELEAVAEELENDNLSPTQRRQLTARLAAIGSQMRALRCPTCFPE
jgi:hypothetical protein